ncbi:MAG: carbohydrate kinase family protein [Oscillospiraceae bacterium]|nr:carbohydrate kinase family protein [Oscillospiraceae bacterium]
MASTAVFGVAFVDIKGFPFNKYIPTGTNLGNITIVHGGVSRNVCEDFANVGMPVDFVSVTDHTIIGQDVINHLENIGVGTDYITLIPNRGVGMWLAVMDEKGDLAASTSQMPDLAALEAFIGAKGEEIVAKCENIILEIDMNEAIAEKVLSLAEKYNKKVYVIVGNLSIIGKRPDFLSRVDCYICNEIEAGKFFEMDLEDYSPEQMLEVVKIKSAELRVPSMVVTMGKNGAVFYDSRTGEEGHCPCFPCKLVDTTGAGDAFLSGTVMGLTKGYSLEKAVRAGTMLASATIQVEESSCPKNPKFFDQFAD